MYIQKLDLKSSLIINKNEHLHNLLPLKKSLLIDNTWLNAYMSVRQVLFINSDFTIEETEV